MLTARSEALRGLHGCIREEGGRWKGMMQFGAVTCCPGFGALHRLARLGFGVAGDLGGVGARGRGQGGRSRCT